MSASFTLAEVMEATGGSARGTPPAGFDSVTTDSRKVPAGSLFVALQGERFDGHAFVETAAKAGAAGALVRRGVAVRAPERFGLVEVDDTLVALGRLGRAHRRRFSIPLGAITGSNGKTTTKEMIGAILETRGPALKTEGNLNNEIGVPLTLFRLAPEQTAAILEMGMNHPGELERLSSYVEPDCAEITSVSAAHLEGLKTIEAVARAKGEIYAGLRVDGLAIANVDDPLVLAQAKACGRRLMTFGKAQGADVRLTAVDSHDTSGLALRIGWQGREHRCQVRFVGEHNAVNACGAFAMGVALGCSPEQCVVGLEAARPWAHRLSTVEAPSGFTVIDDCYNANPGSMAAALSTLRSLGAGRRLVAVLGDMLEMGEAEVASHEQVGRLAAEAGVSILVAFGPRSKAIHQAFSQSGAACLHEPEVASVDGALEFLRARLRQGDVVLVKGSRGMRLERVVEGLTGVAGGNH
ncbi:MAG TPA: UDP-N-acetylmuramoyl-tripeptide--D-alanyl-D-alanine ligase [Myxococcales bacterium]|nr:UDP-N-acetylmuramoyl-tripeptide--D-alanyl-D-alanine ligase [Myxococcales bacterium]